MHGVSPSHSVCSTFLQLYHDELFSTGAAIDAATKDDLMAEVDRVLILHSKLWIASFDRRFLPYMSIFDTMELIDPTAPYKEIMPEVWDAVKMICIRFDLNFAETKREIRSMRRDSEDLSRQDTRLCKENLLKYYHDEVCEQTLNYNNFTLAH